MQKGGGAEGGAQGTGGRERRRQAHGSRRQSDREVLAFADRIGVGVFILRGRFHYVNQALCALSGQTAGQLETRELPELVTEAQRPQLCAELAALLRGEVTQVAQTVRFTGPPDTARWMDLSLQPLMFDGQPSVLGTAYDVTERVQRGEALARASESLRQAMHDAQSASRTKSAFLAAMSHEMRTPLNAVLGMIEVLGDSRLSREQRGYLELMDKAGRALMTLISDLLDLAKVEAGQFDLHPSDFDLEELLEEVLDFHRVDARGRGLELACTLLPGVTACRFGDRPRLRQVLLNLVGNALKFTETGTVSIEVGPVPGKPSILQFAVRDTGMGIPKEFLEKVFEVFVQVDSSSTRRHAGVGLGLAICRRIVELMHGRIWVESASGLGSVFSFTAELPEGNAIPAKASALLAEASLSGLPVLIVDDIAVNRLFVRAALAPYGAQIQETDNPETALAMLTEALQAGRPYALLVTDYAMPKMDGLELVRRYRPLTGSRATAIIMASSEENEHTAAWRTRGVARFLLKPVKRAELLAAAAYALDRQAPVAPGPATPGGAVAPVAGPSRRILLAEDNPENRALVLAYLKQHPYRIDIAENGRIAVQKFCTGDYELALMDVQMPELDGLEATREIRQWETAQGRGRTPILILTSHAQSEDVQRSHDAGADEHIAKPIRKRALLDALARFLPAPAA